MGAERGGGINRGVNETEKYPDTLAQARRLGRKDAKKIIPILKRDPDWRLVTGKKKPVTDEDYKRKSRGLTRLTKKAVNLLFPQFKTSVRYDRGTARHWVDVEIAIPEEIKDPQRQNVGRRVKMMLKSTGLKYSEYFPDSFPGKDDWRPCLLVQTWRRQLK
jgi:hypothetical protein